MNRFRCGNPMTVVAVWLTRKSGFALSVCLLAGFLGTPLSYGMTQSKTLPDLVAESEWIVEATLVSAQPRWNSRGNLIVTDYHFQAERVLAGMPPGATFVLTQGGGTIGIISHALSDTPPLRVGNRYLLFVRPDRGEVFAPFVGSDQGVYLLRDDGMASSLGPDGTTLESLELFAEVDALVAHRGGAAPRIVSHNYVPEIPYSSKQYLPIALTPVQSAHQQLPQAGVDSPDDVPLGSASAPAFQLPGVEEQAKPAAPSWYVPKKINPPQAFNQLLPSQAPFSPADQGQMIKWNHYGGTIFTVYVTPSPTWSFGNGRFDMAGFQTDAQMQEQFGAPWASGTLAITYTYFTGDTIVEADVILNAAYCWTVDEARALNPADSCIGFNQVVLHELGHAWGLGHPFEVQDVWWDSVMNYFGKPFNTSLLRMDDAFAVRQAFGGPARHDVMVSLHTTQARGVGTTPLYLETVPAAKTVKHGQNLSQGTNPFRLENLGIDAVTTPTVEFHLAATRQSWADNVMIGSAGYESLPATSSYGKWMPALPVPATVPTGNYYLGAFIRSTDDYNSNNSAWGVRVIRIENNPPLLIPKQDHQVTGYGYIGPAGEWVYRFNATAGSTYRFTLCDAEGGTANFDTTLRVYNAAMVLQASNDDACPNFQSAVTLTAASSGQYSVVVRGWSTSQGRFKLAYWLVGDVIFSDGFETITRPD